MQWTPENVQWAEQHFDITSTTRSPAHKADAYRGHLQRSGVTASAAAAYQYTWANDDITALTASNLLKKYAEKYSGVLEAPGERALLSYADPGMDGPGAGLLSGHKVEAEPWQDGLYHPLGCVAELLPGAGKDVPICASLCSSPGVAGSGSLTEPSFSGSSCGSQTASQEYLPGAGYSGSYLHPGYSGHPAPALPSPLLQPPPHPTLLPTYNTTSPSLSAYGYPPAAYPHQTAPGYSPPPPSSYLPSGIAAPTPLPPSTLPGYSFSPHSLALIAPTALSGSAAGASVLKRKAFYMAGGQGDMQGYGEFSYGPTPIPAHSPRYGPAEGVAVNGSRGGGFDRPAEGPGLPFKPANHGGSLSPGAYGPGTPRSAESFGSLPSPAAALGKRLAAEQQLQGVAPRVLELVSSSEVLQQLPPLAWSEVAGLDAAKAALQDEVLWPMLRPDMFGAHSPPRAVLLFGPEGAGRTLLARCAAGQLGAPFLHLRCPVLLSDWLAEAEDVLRAAFALARARQPAVLLLSQVDAVLGAQLREEAPAGRLRRELLAQLDAVTSPSPSEEEEARHVLVLCSTSRPQELDRQAVRRYFGRRLLVPAPDGAARQQLLGRSLSLSEDELELLVQRTDGLSGRQLGRLCQRALSLSSLRPVTYQDLHGLLCEAPPAASPTDRDAYAEWDAALGQ